MEAEDFNKLCESAKVVSVSGDEYNITITFDNKVIVTVATKIEWGSANLTYDTNIEEAQRIRVQYERQAREQAKKDVALTIYKEVESKYTPEQWAEIQNAFKNK